MRLLLVVTLSLVIGCQWSPCDARRSLSEQIDVQDAASAKIVAYAGSLRVTGDAGISRVEASAEACASDEAALDEMDLLVERRGEEVYVETVMGGGHGWSTNRRMDLVVSLPDSLAVEIIDKSGDLRVERVATAKIDDKSGNIVVDDVRGSLEIEDKSGDIRIDHVVGDVRVDDKSGNVQVSNVSGDVIVYDKSGDIIVRDVAGGLSVPDDGSGEVDHKNVQGRVTLDD